MKLILVQLNDNYFIKRKEKTIKGANKYMQSICFFYVTNKQIRHQCNWSPISGLTQIVIVNKSGPDVSETHTLLSKVLNLVSILSAYF